MITNTILDLARFDIKLGDYAVGPATAVADASALVAAQDYRRSAAARMMPIGQADIPSKIPSGDYHVSRKVDGEFTVLNFVEGSAFSINPGGTVRIGLPWLQEAAEALSAAGIKKARIAGELHVHRDQRRARVHDVSTVARNPKTAAELQQLRFAAFDVIDIDGQPAAENYAATYQTLESLFGKCQSIAPVETRVVQSIGEIQQLYVEWVENENAEGLVVRSDSSGTFKIKPRHTLDAIVIGFTESTEDRQGMLHDLLLALMRHDGTLHVLTRVGGGFSDDLRRSMLSDLQEMVVSSEYVEVNSDYVAYKMVKPEWVVEISCLDLISETTRGRPVNRMVIDFESATQGYRVVRRLPLVTAISPQFVRRREDKQARVEDVRLSQVTDIVEVAMTDADAKSFSLPVTEVLRRQVYTKLLKGAMLVRKFVLLKTNKEQSGDEFPAYVVHYTDFSPNRKEALTREVMVSNSRTQIDELYEALKTENIKKGWSEAVI